MLARLPARVLARVHASSASLVGLKLAFGARQHGVARSFLTSASVDEPAAKARPSETVGKPVKTRKAQAETRSKTKTKTKAKVKAKTGSKTKSKAKSGAKSSLSPEAQAAKEAKKKAAAKKAKEKALQGDPERRLKLPLKVLKLKKEELPPQAPRNAYSIYIIQRFADVSKQLHKSNEPYSFATISRHISEEWRQMSEEEKKPVYERMEKTKEEHRKALEHWVRTVNPRIVRAYEVQSKHNISGKFAEHQRPAPPWSLFSSEHWHDVEVPDGTSPRETLRLRVQRLSEMWKTLPEVEKKRYIDKARELRAEYNRWRAVQQASAAGR